MSNRIDAETAKEAARAGAFREIRTADGCGCENCTARLPDRFIVHCFIGFMGADWDLAGVEELIDKAEDIYWARWLDHELTVRTDRTEYHFGIKAPVGALA